jgi:hypothetical protein
MSDCVEFTGKLVDKLLGKVLGPLEGTSLPEEFRKDLETRLKKILTPKEPGKLCLRGHGAIVSCRAQSKTETRKNCCKFSERPKLEVEGFPAIDFTIGTAKVVVTLTGVCQKDTWSQLCNPEAGCENDKFKCHAPRVTLKISVSGPAFSATVEETEEVSDVTLEIDCS